MSGGSGGQAGGEPLPLSADPPERERRRERRTAVVAVVCVVALLAGLYAAAVFAAGDRLPRGTSVAGIAVGGLSPQAAERRLREQLQPRASEPVAVSVDGRTARLDPAAAGLTVDVPATVERAGGGSLWNPAVLWDSFFGGDEVPPTVRADQDALLGSLRTLSGRLGRDVVEPQIRFDGTRVVVSRPTAGLAVDVGEAAAAIRSTWLVEDSVLALPTTTIEPKAGGVDLRSAARTAREMVSAPLRLRLADTDVRLRPARYAPALGMRLQDGELTPSVNPQRLARRLRDVIGPAGRPPVDARVRVVDGRPRVLPSRPGVRVDARDVADAVLVAATRKSRTARVTGEAIPAEFTTADARGLGIRRRVSSFVTYYPHADYRNINLGRAAELINGTILRPGETFSLNETVGERTAANGFVEGFIISGGVFAEDFGGGVSQVATTVFNAAFFAGLEDVEHKPHSFYIDRYPAGREATVAWPTVDLRFRNDTKHGVLLRTYVQPSSPGGTGSMHAEVWSTKTWDIRARSSGPYAYVSPGTQVITGDACVPSTGVSGFQIDVFRDFYRPGSDNRVRTERFQTTYNPLDTVTCR
jgi:vancomycin resistance protein YoaR